VTEAGDEERDYADEGDLRGLVDLLCRSLVDEPEAVEVEEVDEEGDLVFEVRVEGGDLGRLIGRGGKVASAIRTIVKAAARSGGGDGGRRVLVEFVED
jgi:predicted RNA-binding protein YlqC (UPF0109 family)